MASQQTNFHPGSKTDWRKRLSAVTHYIDDLESCLIQANSNLAQAHCINENKAIPQDAEDVWCEVKDKLTAVISLFDFYDSLEFYNKPASFRKRTAGGACRILDDCIDKLDALFKK